ncbi:DNA repair endonuclease XPF isoform X2 [Tribolium madens]|uniref:DNA repair endonuclease XPF isoform X2 n=1 Tax=Tribolium madens TaxID=41895 RepID=UPI001CF73E58|nr:DNA repair endonuclease XPF isoform X2 [Tribolium madens]
MAEKDLEPSELDKLLDKTDLEYMLEFETQIFLDILHKDGLVVAAKGLNLDLVLLNLFKVFSDPGNLVIVLNATEAEEKFFINKINDGNIHSTTFNISTTNREDAYLSGGIHFITTRILVVDLLKNRVPIDKITGFVILRAHKVLESCQEAFALRLYRQKNKTGFIKAFSNSVQSFTMGFGHVERIMRTLFVKELYIWPRFHSMVIQSLKQYEPQVIELHVPISENMSKMQTYILDLMNITVKELKRINKTVELQEITVENCLTKQFQKNLQIQLDNIWNQLSEKSKQLVADLKTLRHLIITMHYADPVTFYSTLSTYRSMEYAQTATWVLTEPAELLFSQAGSLIFTGDRELNPEFCPKWKSLLELLKVEIPHEIAKSKSGENIILILCTDHKTCYQLNQLLSHGPHKYLFLNALDKKVTFKKINDSFQQCGKIDEVPEPAKKPKLDESNIEDKPQEEEIKSSYVLTMSQTPNDESQYIFEQCDELENLNITQICQSVTAPTVLIQTFKGTPGTINLQRTLHEINPSFIIMYHSNITAIREIEMYEAHRKRDAPLKVYFLIHGETVEEQSYLTSLRREKEAFEYLIETKSKMVVPEDQDGKSDLCLTLQRDLISPSKNTRHGGRPEEVSRKYVIVDMREFRSELPALIHKRGVDIEPVTIAVGDYILTPEICVERKSLSDLVGSLNSGRLYQQCTQMFRYYAKPMLLIEFDQNKPFSWQNQYMVSSDTNSFDIQKKLLLLSLHFPKLKIIWSPSPYATAQLFEELMVKRSLTWNTRPQLEANKT